jgi:UDP-N-acetylmuramate dehydrogenase
MKHIDIGMVADALAEGIAGVQRNVGMADHTSFRVGGCADILAVPTTIEEITHAVRTAHQYACPMLVTGRGTNLLVTSKGIRGIVLKLGDNYAGLAFSGQFVTAKSGTTLASLVRDAMAQSLGGIAYLGGIPGTVGGAVYMNAGAYGGEIGDVVREVYLVSHVGEVTLTQDEMAFGYRKSLIMSMPFVVTGAKLRLKECRQDEIKERVAEYAQKRRSKQPLEYPSAGSTFKRPTGHYAGALIEQAGLKGLSVGGAQVSEKHAGFIVNTGGATPEDIIALIAQVQQRVFDSSGVRLEPEVRIVGER